jgi:Tol biopolymer transport system component
MLRAQRFNLDRLELTGSAETLASGLEIAGFGASDLALSSTGDLLYVPGGIRSGFFQLDWVSRAGAKTPVDSTTVDGVVGAISLSPDGSAVALELLRPSDLSSVSRIWVKRLGGGPTQVVTTENRTSQDPIWAPGGHDLLYHSADGTEIYRRRADGSGSAELVAKAPPGTLGMTMLKDGKTLVVRGNFGTARRGELYQIHLGTDSMATPLLASPGGERSPAFSPDGRWLAYVSSESGSPEVYVRPYPDVDTRKIQISVDGGDAPRWNPAGGELFYISTSGDLMAARIETTPAFKVSGVTRLFTPIGFQGGNGALFYDVSPDGKRFLMLDIGAAPSSAGREQLVMVQNFAAELKKRLPR